MNLNNIIQGDCLKVLSSFSAASVDCCITSPPYWGLRDYGVEGQLGLEKTPEEYVANMVKVFAEVKRVLKKEGTLWLNLGDSYWGGKGTNGSSKARNTAEERGYTQSGGTVLMDTRPQDGRHEVIKPKDLVGIPWRVAFALQAGGWYLRQDIIWAKPNPMPESVTDRCTKSHEYVFLLSKNSQYYFDHEAMKEASVTDPNSTAGMTFGSKNGKNNTSELAHAADLGHKWEYSATRNKRSVWTVTTQPFREAHFATFPEDLIVPMIKAGCPPKGIVLDPFMGAGTTGLVARKLQRNYLGIELNPAYVEMAQKRIAEVERQPVLV